ncbi:DUF2931 family protein [Sungkyunkwania multivorans]|uniref:DUF2931 family protein n=1 Tax=Sungkyunkwania multivorans TaxID=1173618 RepID=A0ABW3D6L3_9FLAO
MMKRSLVLWTLFLSGILTVSCQSNTAQKPTANNQQMKKFEWRPSVSAPKIYPIQIHKGFLYGPDGNAIQIPRGRIVKNGWGKTGASFVIGEDIKPVPNRLEVTWLSLSENQFYAGSFELPAERMVQNFETTFIDQRDKEDAYNSIVIGLAPGGMVSVWMRGPSKSIEVANFKAAVTDIPMEEFNPLGTQNREEYVQNRLNSLDEKYQTDLEEKGVDIDKWDAARAQFSWKLNFSPIAGGELATVLAEGLNGEHFFVRSDNRILEANEDLFVPAYLKISWYDTSKNKYGAKIYLDEEETLKAFWSLSKEAKMLELIIEVDRYHSNINIYLQGDDARTSLQKARSNVYATVD